ncbi:uncharacterized protein [Panulirus ornatus]|uniref:uncharacterized protein isoform X2 n=1 Tax=Panulirus ornatus TaxID=150431 RepID=UPI003A8B1349
MADVAVSEPAQSHMSIVRQDGPEDTGGTALIPSGRQPARKTRLRKVRPPDLKGGRGTKEKTKKSTVMASRPPPHRDYLSEQRAKRMEKLKAKERHDGSRRSLGRVRAEETKGEGDVERPDGVVTETEEIAAEAEEALDEIVKEVERPTGDGEEQRGVSAGSDVSKDEGISSNGEKDEEFESEFVDGSGKVGDAEQVDDIDDDEGRGSIKDEAEEDAELSLAPDSGEVVEAAAETEAAIEAPAADDVGDDATSKPALENGEDTDLTTIAQEEQQEEEEGEEVQPDTENTQEPETTNMVSHAGETEEHADEGAERNDEDKTHYIEDDAAGYQGDMDEPNSLAASFQGSLGLSSDAGLGTTADTSVLRSTLEEMQTATWEEEEATAATADEEPTNQEKEEDSILMEEAEGEEPRPKETEEEEQTKADENGEKEEEQEEEETIDKNGEGEKVEVEEEPEEEEKEEEEETIDKDGEGEEVKVEEEPEEEEEEEKKEEEEEEEKDQEAETLEDQQEITHVKGGEEEEEEEKEEEDTETEKLEEQATEDAEPEREAEGSDDQDQADQEDDVNAEVEVEQVDNEDALSRVVEEEEEIEGEDGQGRDVEAGDDDEGTAANDGEELDATQEQGMGDVSEEGEKDNEEIDGEKDSQDGEEPKISSEVEPESVEAPDAGVVEGESGDPSEAQEPEREEEEEREEEGEEKDDDDEEEIKEVPAIARIPGRYRGRRNQTQRPPQIQEPEVRKTPRNKPYDRSKVMANRKPISWRPTPIQASGQPEVGKLRNDKSPNNKFKARNLTLDDQNGTVAEGDEPATHESENGERDLEGGQRDKTAGEFLDLPPVNIPTSDDASIVLESFRSEGHLSQADSQVDEDSQVVSKAESLPDVRYQDITRPNTAGKRGKTRRRRKVKSRVASTPSKQSAPQQGGGRSTSEVWVPHEDKLYVYTYSSQPRLLHVRRMGAGRVATTHQWDQDPNSSFRLKTRGNGNPMYDRRVVRGSNYAKRLGSDHEGSDPASQSQQQQQHHLRRQEFREKLEARARLRRESHGVSSLYPSHGASHHHPHRSYPRVHAQVQTENHYEPLERPPEAEAEVQTDPWGEEGTMPPVVFQTPRGVDVDTQVYDTELDADDEEDVLVAALVRRTMQEAVLEVAQEEQAEEDRINRIAASSCPSFLKPAEKTEDVQEDRGEEGSTEEERKDPDGKETSPEDTEEPARSPEVAGSEEAAGEVKEIHLITAVEASMSPVPVAHDAVQESQSLVI